MQHDVVHIYTYVQYDIPSVPIIDIKHDQSDGYHDTERRQGRHTYE